MYQKEFDKAKILLDDIINNGGFELASNFYDNYDMTHENNSESIFEIQANNINCLYFIADFRCCVPSERSCKLWGVGIFSAITMSI